MGHMEVEFEGERGLDYGGLIRDFFSKISKSMFDRQNALFIMSGNGSSYMPDSKSVIQGVDHTKFFKFVGRIIGKALHENCLMDCYFVKSMYKMMIG